MPSPFGSTAKATSSSRSRRGCDAGRAGCAAGSRYRESCDARFHPCAEQLLRSEIAGIPVIGLTAYEALRRHALEMGFAAALLTPCNVRELSATIRRRCPHAPIRTRAKRA